MRAHLPLIVLTASLSWCQQPGELSARALFYREQPDQDKLPPVAEAKPAPTAKPTAAARPPKPAKTPQPVAQQKQREPRTSVPVIPVVQNLGLRYNVMLVDTASGAAQPADPERKFRRGECLALEFEANRSGYLYVLEQGSSGRWQPLFPSEQMPDESNIVRARTRVRVPSNHCFQIEDPPGVERMFVVLSRNPEDLYDLHQAIRGGQGGTTAPVPAGGAQTPPVMLAMARLNREVDRFAADLRSRDLKIVKIARPEAAGEPANSVYVVNASTAAPADRVVTEIRIDHR
jgi:hypothetical protein